MGVHDEVLRRSMKKHYGYELFVRGDAFVVAFHAVDDALAWCLRVQLDLMQSEWPAEMHDTTAGTLRVWGGGLAHELTISACERSSTAVTDIAVLPSALSKLAVASAARLWPPHKTRVFAPLVDEQAGQVRHLSRRGARRRGRDGALHPRVAVGAAAHQVRAARGHPQCADLARRRAAPQHAASRRSSSRRLPWPVALRPRPPRAA